MKLGFTMKELRIARSKFTDQKNKAGKRGILFKFTFPDWLEWWVNTGKWHERGKRPDQYCMSRYGDLGPYELGNVFCNTNLQNCISANLGRKHGPEVLEKRRMTIAKHILESLHK